MPRNSHTLSRFKGILAAESIANIPPDSCIDSLNVYGDTGGWVNVCQQPSILNRLGTGAAIASMGLLAKAGSYPRLLIQQGQTVRYSDHPYSSAADYTEGLLSGIVARLDYCQANGIAFFSNGQDGRYVLPGDDTAYRWGIEPPPSPKLIVSTTYIVGVTIQRVSGVTTVTFGSPHGAVVGDPVYVDSDPAAPWDASFGGLYAVDSVPSPTSLTYLDPGPDAGPFSRANYPAGLTATSYTYGASYGASKIPHWSSLSAYSTPIGPLAQQSPTLLVSPTSDWQVDEVALFRNQDEGGVYYLTNAGENGNGIVKLIDSGPFEGYGVLVDSTTDEQLAESGQQAPYDNGVSPNGKYVAVWLDRVLMCGIPGDPTAVKYTGYDSISFGCPQMCWCTYNSVKLGQGEATPIGMGLLRYGGMVFFGTDGLMYIYRGTLNDITVSAPTSLTFYAEQLPYKIGCYSHFSIQSCPAGLVWLDDGFNLRVYENSGFYPPRSLAPQVAGLLKRITPGSQEKVESAYINYLQRDWYILSFPIDGSLTNNALIIVDVSQEQDKSTGAWMTDYEATAMQWITYPDGTRHLLAAMPYVPAEDIPPTAGYITEVPLVDNITQGVEDQRWVVPTNPPMPGAFVRLGYFGLRDENSMDESSTMKLFRYVRMSSNLASRMEVVGYIVDGDEYTFDSPLQVAADVDEENPMLFGLNVKGRALSLLVRFPDDSPDPATLLTLTAAWVPTGQR